MFHWIFNVGCIQVVFGLKVILLYSVYLNISVLLPGRYYRHCGSRSAVEMGGDMRGFGGHVGAAAVLVSLRQICRPGGGKNTRRKNARRRCRRQGRG